MISFSEQLHEYIVKNLTFPLSNYMFNRKNILSKFNAMRESEWYSAKTLKELQFNKLRKVIEYANAYVPYYRDKLKEIGLFPEDIKNLEDLQYIPPLSRHDVIEFHDKMVDFRFKSSRFIADKSKGGPGQPKSFARFRRHKLVRNSSSGSTGVPTVFYEDGSQSALNWAHELRFKSWFGIHPGVKEARMVRLSSDYLRTSRLNKSRRLLWNQLVLPGMNLSEKEYKLCLNDILKFKPRVLWGITSSITGLANYITENNKSLQSYNPEIVITWAAPLHDHEKQIINKAFNSYISNIYSAREVGHIAGMCSHGSYHVNQEDIFVENEITDNNSVNGNYGEIYVTTLNCFPMPFIRYKMGDVGLVGQSRCACGRTLQVLEKVLGRTGEIFISKEGRMIAPNFWGRVFMSEKVSGIVKQFQVIYKKNKDLKIIIESYRGHSTEAESYLMETIKDNLSTDTKVEFIYVSKIKPQLSGKYQMVINEANI